MEGGILIVDFGSQYTQLIARKIRELNVYTVIHPLNKVNKNIIEKLDPSGIILSGGPNSVLEKKFPICVNKRLLSEFVDKLQY